jgi:hypothetical protein
MRIGLLFWVLILLSEGTLHAQQKIRLTDNWEFLKQDIGGIWEAMRPMKKGNPEEGPLWTKVSPPHYYQGPWVSAKKGKLTVADSISFQYQTEKWNKPARLLIEKIKEANDTVTIQAKLLDDKSVQCLDAANFIRFGLAGDRKLIDNLGTSSGSPICPVI